MSTIVQCLLGILQKIDLTILRPGTVIVSHKPEGIIETYIRSTFETYLNTHIFSKVTPELLTAGK